MRNRSGRAVALLAAILVWGLVLPGPAAAAGIGPVEGGALPGPLPLFPSDNWWNLDISGAPVDANSAGFISFINNGSIRHLHPDFGGEVFPGSAQVYGMPYAVVDGTQPKLTVDFLLYPDESDGVGVPFYPIPTQAISQPHWVEGGDPGNVDLRGSEDRHLFVVDRDNKYLYELYNVYHNASTGRWEAGSGAFWDMKTNNRRPEGWTSADAAGLAILPGLVRYDEAYDPAVADIQHAFRVTVRATNGHVYPASHSAGSTSGALPMGARLRLRAAKDISGFTPEVQKVFRAMKTYGLIVADNGSDMFVTGTFDTRWNNDILNPAFYALTASDFEVVQLGWNPADGQVSLDSLAVTPASVAGGQSSTGIVTLSGPAPGTGVAVTLSSTNPAVASVPPSVTIGAGVSSTSFSITTFAVASSTPVDIIASADGATRTATLTVTPPPPPKLSSLTLSPSTVAAGSSSTGTVTLSGPAPAGGALVTLASSKPAVAAVPADVTVAAGTSSASFTVSTATASSNTSAVISASYNGSTKAATLSIRKRKR
ncbi:MAG: hypothetical protein DMD83_04200 [Candidatus Rokuibacteriota bacterium]|nr:MAG: hypothetical protein DMD83_04200 [Candidatus Rokubacteria bacterium]